MRLTVTTPLAVVVDVDDVESVRAEDETGAFGIQRHHGGFLTVLAISVLSWRDGGGKEHHIAVRGGALTVRGGSIEVAAHDAVAGDDLAQLEHDVLTRFRREASAADAARSASARLELTAMRRIFDYVRGIPPRRASAPGEERSDGRR